MSTTPEKTPNESKKPSFWEKLSEKKTAVGGSLVDAIVRQAEKEANSKKGDAVSKKVEDSSFYVDNKAKNKARASLGNARTIFGLVVILAVGSWLYFFATLDEGNYFHEKFGLENLTTEMNRKVELSEKILADTRDTKKFGNLLKIENLASRILAVDLESTTLNYIAPIGERVVSRSSDDKASEIFVKTTNDVGVIIYVPESEIRTREDIRGTKIELAIVSVEEIVELAEELKGAVVSESKMKESFKNVMAEIAKIDLDDLDKDEFPSSVLKSNLAVAQSFAKNILKEIKNSNLRNLVSDIKNQIQTIDIIGADEATQRAVVDLQNILAQLHHDRPSTFENALAQIESIGIENISDDLIYQKVVRIIGDPRSTEKNIADLQTAAMIAQNIGRVNIVNILESDRITWSTVIERTQKIARLGADLERDLDKIPTNEDRDLDPDGELIGLFSYSGESEKDQIEIQGFVAAEQNYEQKAFTLVADLIDAIEASKYFQNVDGFTFSKETDRSGKVTAPFNLSLDLQDPANADERDVKEVIVERARDAGEDDFNIDDIDFSLDDADGESSDSADEEDPAN